MKKTVKIIFTILLTIMLMSSVASIVFAADLNNIFTNVNNATANGTEGLTNIGGKIVNVIQIVGILVAIIVILVIGIKYMTGSVEQKAEYKKTMIPYVVGAVLLVAGTSIVKVIYNTINNNSNII